MKIKVYEYPNCTWILDGDTFFCSHDIVEVVTDEVPYMSFDGVNTYETEGYVCAECGEPLEGSPAEDRADAKEDYEMDCE